MDLEKDFPFSWQRRQWHRLHEARRLGRLPHALLLSGMPGLGKSLFAEELARALLCEQPGENGRACGTCRACGLMAAGSHPDLHYLSPEEGSSQIRIEAIRKLREDSTLVVGDGSRRVFLIDPAEVLGGAAANALLKTLEEPLGGIHLLLVSSHPERLPITIRSRCQQVRFLLPPMEEAAAWLTGQAGIETGTATQLLAMAAGAPLRALAMIDNGEDREYRKMAQEFVEVARGELDPVLLAGQWSGRVELPLAMSHLTSWLLLLVRQQMSGNAGGNPVVEFLQTTQTGLDLRSIFKLLDNLFEMQRGLNHNLNAQLVLEELLLEWHRIARGAH